MLDLKTKKIFAKPKRLEVFFLPQFLRASQRVKNWKKVHLIVRLRAPAIFWAWSEHISAFHNYSTFMTANTSKVNTKISGDSDKLAYRLPQIEHIVLNNNKNRSCSYETVYFGWGVCTNKLTSLFVSQWSLVNAIFSTMTNLTRGLNAQKHFFTPLCRLNG